MFVCLYVFVCIIFLTRDLWGRARGKSMHTTSRDEFQLLLCNSTIEILSKYELNHTSIRWHIMDTNICSSSLVVVVVVV